MNKDSSATEIVNVKVTSTMDPGGVGVILNETEVDSGIFTGTIGFDTSKSEDTTDKVHVVDHTTIFVIYEDATHYAWIDSALWRTFSFDTGPGAYPSIFGVHNGTITPANNVTANKMYTYSCAGTGGHSEYVAFYHANGTLIAEASWTGYQGADDYHYIVFGGTFRLEADVTYNYTIETGSYPQIIREQNHTTSDGSLITCTKFIDANGKVYSDWIPAITLFF